MRSSLTASSRATRGHERRPPTEPLAGDGDRGRAPRIVHAGREIASAISELAAIAAVVLTDSGTGVAPRRHSGGDAVGDRRARRRIAEAIRADSLAKTPHALLSRSGGGVSRAHASSSTCRAGRAAAATATPCSAACAGHALACSPKPRRRTGRRDDDGCRLPRRSPSLAKLGAPASALRSRTSDAAGLGESPRRRTALGDGGDGRRRTLAMSLDRLIDADRRANPARRAASCRPGRSRAGRCSTLRRRARWHSPRRRLPARPGRALAGRSRPLLRRLPVPQADHLAMLSARRPLGLAPGGA